MSSLPIKLHELFNQKTRLSFPFDKKDIPENGIYIIFEKGETLGELDRIVRIGTHEADNNLITRLNQHFSGNKNGSAFRKYIGFCIISQENPKYLPTWKLKSSQHEEVNKKYERELEECISHYIKKHTSFIVFEVNTKEERLFWEKKLIATLAQSDETKASDNWLGNHSPELKIKQSGLWQTQHIKAEILTDDEFDELVKLVG